MCAEYLIIACASVRVCVLADWHGLLQDATLTKRDTSALASICALPNNTLPLLPEDTSHVSRNTASSEHSSRTTSVGPSIAKRMALDMT